MKIGHPQNCGFSLNNLSKKEKEVGKEKEECGV